MTNSNTPPVTPDYRRAHVQPREITLDPAFAIRDTRDDHVRTLTGALRNTGQLERLLLWDDRRDPTQPRLVLVDGRHRLAAYLGDRRQTKSAKGIPVLIVTCDEIAAHRLAAQRNSRDKLPLTFSEKMNLAWGLVWIADAVLSKADIVNDTGVSRSTVNNMRKRRRAMVAAGTEPTGKWSRDAKDNLSGQPEEIDMEAKIKELVEALKGPAEAMRREPAGIKWEVLERVFGTYEARQFAFHGLHFGADEFDDKAPALEEITTPTEPDENSDF